MQVRKLIALFQPAQAPQQTLPVTRVEDRRQPPPVLPPEDPYRSDYRTHSPQQRHPVKYVDDRHQPPHLPPEDPYRLGHLSHVTPLELRYIRQAHADDTYAHSGQVPHAIESRNVPLSVVSASNPYYRSPAVDPYQMESTRAHYPENPIRDERYVIDS